MVKELKVALIGCGLIGNKRAAALPENCSLTIVYDLNQARARELADKYQTQIAEDLEQVFATTIDIVLISVVHNKLAELTLAAVKNGKHVLVEKPAACHDAELEEIIALAEEKQLVVKVGYNHRFHPAILQAKDIVESGEIGELMYLRGRYGHGGRIGYEQEWRADKEISGGGELIDQGSHLIDLSRWFLGELQVEYAYLPTLFWPMQVEDNCFMALKNQDNKMAWLHASWTEWKNMFNLEIYCKTGKLIINGLGGSYGKETLTYHKMLPEMGPPKTEIFAYPSEDLSWQKETKEFIQAIEQGLSKQTDIKDAYQNLRIIKELYNYADSKKSAKN